MRTSHLRILLASVLALPSVALVGCGDGCPEPLFAEPAVPDGIQSPPSGDDFVVVSWPATEGDPLPDDYYAAMEPDELPAGVTSVRHDAPRQLAVSFSSSEPVTSTPTELDIPFSMGDTQDWTDCSHPGMPDQYFVSLHLSFDGRGGVVASFSEVGVSLGACAASGPGRTRASPWWLVPLAVGYLWLRRRRVR